MFKEAPEFLSYRGLYKTAFNHSELLHLIEHLVEQARDSSKAAAPQASKPEVRLLDTFFSDTLNETQVTDIVKLCNDFSSDLKILILNPHSSFAVARGKSLKVNPIEEINKAIIKLRRALRNVLGAPRGRLAPHSEEDIQSTEFLNHQLAQLKEERGQVNLTVRFYEVMTETPVYIISNFAAKGLIIDQHSAAFNPWMVFLDIPHQSGDIFDCLKKSFDTIWENSSTECPLARSANPSILSGKTKVFLSQAHMSSVAERVRKYIEEHLALEVVVYTDSAVIGRGPFENLEAMTSRCGYAVIVLTKDDQVRGRTNQSTVKDLPEGRKRGRQNVIHEIGYCQGKMGPECVLILFEDGVEIPSNISYLHGQPFKKGKIEEVFGFLSKHLT